MARLRAGLSAILVLLGACTSDPPSAGTWRPIPAAPGTADGAPVWTGAELVLWSGGGFTGAGAAYAPASGTWRTAASSPLVPRNGHSGVWTGREVVYWGGSDAGMTALADGAAYDPAADRWRAVAPSPLPPRSRHEAVWTGTEMVVWGGLAGCCSIDSVIHATEAAAYDPAADRWRRLPDVPPPWSGDDGGALTGVVDGRVLIWREGRLAVLDPAATAWRDLGAPPTADGDDVDCMMSDGPRVAGTFTAGGLAVWAGGCEARTGAAYDVRTGRWSRLGNAPRGGLHIAVATPQVVAVVWRVDDPPRLWRYDDGDSRWRRLGPQPDSAFGMFATVVWTGDEVLVWGGVANPEPVRSGALFRPHPD